MTTLAIRLDDTTDWGCDGSDEERAAYEQLVADAIGKAYPGADVEVQCLQIAEPRVCVTTRDDDGRVLTDDATARAEESIEEHVREISRDVWDQGAFWS